MLSAQKGTRHKSRVLITFPEFLVQMNGWEMERANEQINQLRIMMYEGERGACVTREIQQKTSFRREQLLGEGGI